MSDTQRQSGSTVHKDVVLVGCGAMARFVLRGVAGDAAIRISKVLVRPESLAVARGLLPSGTAAITSLDELQVAPDLLLELASHAAVAAIIPQALERGFRVVIASTGALADDRLREQVIRSACRGGTQLGLLPGAIGALDVLSAHREAGLESVLYTGTKQPTAWRNTPAADRLDLGRIESPVTIFEGTARDAALLYPRNANVAATLALAGMGFDLTRVRLVADPGASASIHRIEATSAAGRFSVELASEPLPDNPRTSAVTAYSALRLLRNLVEPLCL